MVSWDFSQCLSRLTIQYFEHPPENPAVTTTGYDFIDRTAFSTSRSHQPTMTQSTSISIYVQPRASKTEISGMHDGVLRIRLAAPPVDGAVNQALIAFIAETLDIAKSRVRVVSGLAGRRKVVRIEGMSEGAVAAALGISE